MTKIAYIEKRFSANSLEIINDANRIIKEYQAQGFSLTLRQLYYQFVARGLLPENSLAQYKRIGKVINDARMAGMLDWDAIEDRTRNLQEGTFWDSPASLIAACARQFRYDQWAGQPYQVEVWIEKEALVGVIEPVCTELGMPYFACRGYVSQSEQWSAGQRFLDRWADTEQHTVILHLGDHDPSGVDMTRDNIARLNLFTGWGTSEDIVSIERIALNMDQVETYNPPPNFAKITDTRSKEYRKNYGDESWELDALDPSVIAQLIRKHANRYIDHGLMQEMLDKTQEGKEQLRKLSDNWSDVAP